MNSSVNRFKLFFILFISLWHILWIHFWFFFLLSNNDETRLILTWGRRRVCMCTLHQRDCEEWCTGVMIVTRTLQVRGYDDKSQRSGFDDGKSQRSRRRQLGHAWLIEGKSRSTGCGLCTSLAAAAVLRTRFVCSSINYCNRYRYHRHWLS